MSTIVLKPVTPLWTGNDSGVSDQLRVTGLMGSLRWWFEGLVRAHGYYACDPTEGGCVHEKGEQDLCPACRLFGATGWARHFRMSASGLSATPWFFVADSRVERMHESWLSRVMKPDSKVLWGDELRLRLTEPNRVRNDPDRGFSAEGLVLSTLQVIARFGALGAKTQNGLGCVDMIAPDAADARGTIESFLRNAAQETGRNRPNDPKWFDLSRAIFFDVDVRDPGLYRNAPRHPADARPKWAESVLPIAYDIRYKSSSKNFRSGLGKDIGLRPKLKTALRVRDMDDIVGSPAKSEERTASRVFVTHLYKFGTGWRFRVWLHIPKDSGIGPADAAKPVEELAREMFPGCKVTKNEWADVKRLIS